MSISIINKCSKNIILKQNEEEKVLKPREKMFLNENCFCFSLKTEEKSKKEKFSSSYILSLEAFFSINNASEELIIKREEIKVSYSPSIVCERLIPTDENIKPEYYSITEKEELLKTYKNNRLFDIFVFEPILLHTLSISFYIFIAIGIILGFIFSPLISIIYFVCLYLCSLLIDIISYKLVDTAFSKIFKTKNENIEFKSILDDKFISQYLKEKLKKEDVKTDFII